MKTHRQEFYCVILICIGIILTHIFHANWGFAENKKVVFATLSWEPYYGEQLEMTKKGDSESTLSCDIEKNA